jgi:NADPH:quinone reductase-like Zn-dependent oxidoreductase
MKLFELQAFGLENLKRAERPMPEAGRDEALIRIRAVSLNFRASPFPTARAKSSRWAKQ